ncbi:MAG: hypothetical protein KDA24_13670 [Deltaproteobacteria bacterium]|nr:hypothetical protein [Deltaproteobacteria bacterium]
MRRALTLTALLLLGCPSGETPPLLTAPARTLAFVSPLSGEVENPVAFRVEAHEDVVLVRYVADDLFTLGSSEDVSGGFPFGMDFAILGGHTMTAIGHDEEGDIVAEDTIAIDVLPDPTELNELGTWLHPEDLVASEFTHGGMAQRLADSGIKRLYLPVGEGAPDCGSDPVLCDRDATDSYRAVGVEPWAWMQATAAQEGAAQAETIREAVPAGYHGLVIDLGASYDAAPEAVETLLAAMLFVRSQCDTTGLHLGGNFPLYIASEGAPFDRGLPVGRVDQAVDGYMPRIDLEAATPDQLANPDQWINQLLCEWRGEGASKPVHHVIAGPGPSSENAATLDSMVALAGREASLYSTPAQADDDGWEDLATMDWWTGAFVEPDCTP